MQRINKNPSHTYLPKAQSSNNSNSRRPPTSTLIKSVVLVLLFALSSVDGAKKKSPSAPVAAKPAEAAPHELAHPHISATAAPTNFTQLRARLPTLEQRRNFTKLMQKMRNVKKLPTEMKNETRYEACTRHTPPCIPTL